MDLQALIETVIEGNVFEKHCDVHTKRWKQSVKLAETGVNVETYLGRNYIDDLAGKFKDGIEGEADNTTYFTVGNMYRCVRYAYSRA